MALNKKLIDEIANVTSKAALASSFLVGLSPPDSARAAQGAQEVHPPRLRQHLRLHRQGHRPARRPPYPAQQPQGAGAAEPCLHNCCHWHCGRDMLSVHAASSIDE